MTHHAEPHLRRFSQRSSLEIAYVFAPGEKVSFYPVDDDTKRGLAVRPGVVVEDGKRLTIRVLDPATGTEHRIRPGQAWNDASRAHDTADNARVKAILDARYAAERESRRAQSHAAGSLAWLRTR